MTSVLRRACSLMEDHSRPVFAAIESAELLKVSTIARSGDRSGYHGELVVGTSRPLPRTESRNDGVELPTERDSSWCRWDGRRLARQRAVFYTGDNEMQIVDPEGSRSDATYSVARRPATLAGLRLGLLHNGKPGGEQLLERIAERLRADHGVVASECWRKPHPSAQATFLDELEDRCDVVVGALSD